MFLYVHFYFIIGGLLRANFASMFYMVLFLLNVAFPSYYPYYPLTTIHRLLFIAPRVATYVFTTLYAALFLITQISLQIVFKTNSSFSPPHWLQQLGFVKYVFSCHMVNHLVKFSSCVLLYFNIPISFHLIRFRCVCVFVYVCVA